MENFTNDTEEEQLVDLFDADVEFQETHGKRRKIMKTDGLQKRTKQDMTVLHHYLEALPSADMYERSYMHKDIICQSKI